MTNEILWLIMLASNFLWILVAYRLFGKIGLYAWISIAVIIANLQVFKIVKLFGMTASLGNIVYATSFLATDILAENHGKRAAGKAVGMGFIALTTLTLFMNLAILFEPSTIDSANDSMKSLFQLLPRIALASFAAYGISQVHDVWLFSILKRRHPGAKWLWIRNNLSTMVSQLIDSLIFCSIAFLGLVPMVEFWEITFTTYILKWLVAVADTPMIYLARHWYSQGKISN
ncbi:MAG: hypothetical protein B0D92_06020 [Spirochaeta sp. LUC14_002_19_P3]|nr:MAG: hypothetical protein B0D92_06020 [Spirochaeta sp. LUC14_002_19_P3]